MLTEARVVCQLSEQTEEKSEKGNQKKEKEEGDQGLNEERQRFRTARQRCGKDRAEQIIEARVSGEQFTLF